MILALTEEQAIEIRKTGLSVIQFKYCIKNGISIAVYNLRQFLIAAKSVFEKMGKLHGISEKKEKVMTRTMQIARLGNLE